MRKFFSSTVAVFSITAVILLSGNSVFAQGQGQGQGQGGQQQSPWLRTGNVSSGQSDYLGYQDAAPLIFKTTSAERMKISATGEVSIGVSSTVHKFEVAGGNSKFGGDVLVDGNMGIGTTSPLERLEVMLGNVKFHNDLDVLGIIRVGPALPPCICGGGPPRIEVNGGMRIQSLSGSGNVLATANDEGILSPLAFPNNSSLFLRGDGTFGSIPTFDWTVSGSNLYMIPSGNVGIGTSNVTEKLTVQGNTKVSGTLTANCVNTGCLNVTGQTSFEELNVNTKIKTARIVPLDGDSIIAMGNNTIKINDISNNIFADNATLYIQGFPEGNNNTIINYENSGKVGIGINPSEKLDVFGSIRASSLATGNTQMVVANANGVLTTQAFPAIIPSWNLGGNSGTDHVSNFIGTTDAQDLVFKTNNEERLRIEKTGGNVGIGVIPSQKLHLFSDLCRTSLRVESAYYGAIDGCAGNGTSIWDLTSESFTGKLYFSTPARSTPVMTLLNNGYMGINFTNPANLFHIHSDTTVNWNSYVSPFGGVQPPDPGLPLQVGLSIMQITNASTGTTDDDGLLLGTFNNEAFLVLQEAGPMKFATNDSTRMTIAANGNIGIGTKVPQAKLHLFGENDELLKLHRNSDNPALIHFTNTHTSETEDGFKIGITQSGVADFIQQHNSQIRFFLRGDAQTDPIVERMTILNNGRVGIGTNAPTSKLTVKTKNITTSANNIFSTKIADFIFHNESYDTENITSPQLDVWGYYGYIDPDNGTIGKINLRATSSAGVGSNAGVGTDLTLGTELAPDAVVIKGNTFNAGRVGINTDNPIQKLDVNGRINVMQGVIQRGGTSIISTADLGLYSREPENWIRIVTNNAPIRFYSDGGNGIDDTEDGKGTVANMTIEPDGRVGIGTTTPHPSTKLDVWGTIRACEAKVNLADAQCPPDFVFEKSYDLFSLKKRRDIVFKNKHLPYISSGKEMKSNGLALGEFSLGILQIAEEHELYLYDHDERIEFLENENKELKVMIQSQNKRMDEMQKKMDILLNKN